MSWLLPSVPCSHSAPGSQDFFPKEEKEEEGEDEEEEGEEEEAPRKGGRGLCQRKTTGHAEAHRTNPRASSPESEGAGQDPSL